MISPLIYEKTKDGEFLYDIFSRLIKERIIFLTQHITVEYASTIAATLFFLDHQDQQTPIRLYINSDGGDVAALFTIYDTMNTIHAPVHTYCIGAAASSAAVILAAGSPGGRFAMPNCKIMIHQLQISDMQGTAADIKNEARLVEELNQRVYETLARHSGQPLKKVKQDCYSIDHYMSAAQAIKYGIIDEIIKPTKTIPKLRTEEKKARRRNKKTEVELEIKDSTKT